MRDCRGLSYFTYVFLVTRPITSYHNFLPWPWSLTYFSKTLTLVITYEPRETGHAYFTCIFLGTRLFTSYHNFRPSDLELWITYTKCCYSYLVASWRTMLSSDNSCMVMLFVRITRFLVRLHFSAEELLLYPNVAVRVRIHLQNVTANVKVMKLYSFCISLCILIGLLY